MKEQLYTIPLNDAVNAQDECPFCFIHRSIEQDLLDFVLGSGSFYMEADIREQTDKAGFCRYHFQKMFDYGNTLGNAWILKTHYQRMIREMQQEFASFRPGKSYICSQYKDTYERYLDTFFYLWKNDESFRNKIINGKGFCLPHFGDLCEAADRKLSDKEKQEFYDCLLPVMEANMQRISEDVSWLVEKFDYRNKDADWKNSKDAIQRGMQKLKGGYPADPAYKMSK